MKEISFLIALLSNRQKKQKQKNNDKHSGNHIQIISILQSSVILKIPFFSIFPASI